MLGVDPATERAPGATGSGSCCRSPHPTRASPSANRSSSTPATTAHPRSVTETIALVGLAGKNDRQATSLSGGRATPARLRARPDRRPRADLPRRADNRLRPLGATGGLGRDRQPPRARQDDLPDHALHGRGRAARRPHRRDRRRTDRRPRNTAHARRPRPSTEHDRVHPAPHGSASTELPGSLRELAEPQPDGGVVLHSDTPLAHLALLDEWARTTGVELANLEVTRPIARRHLPDAHTHPTRTEAPNDPHPLDQLSLRHHLRKRRRRTTRHRPQGPAGAARLDPAPDPLRPAQLPPRQTGPLHHARTAQSSSSSRSSASAAATRPSSRTARRSRPQSSSCPA